MCALLIVKLLLGGRVDLLQDSPSPGSSSKSSICGIFIKHVLASSPAGRNGTLKKGDRILEVDGVQLRDATHDEAVAAIKNSRSPVRFVVQSLTAEPHWVSP